MTDEKILKKVGKLLKLYGVDEEEAQKFLIDLKDKKYDDQEELEESDEEKVEEVAEEEITEEEKPTEELGEEKPSEEKVEGEEKVEEEVVAEDEKPAEESLPEKPKDETLPEESVEDVVDGNVETEENHEQEHEDVSKTIEGLMARISALEDLVSKLGTPVEEDVGVSPSNQGAESYKESEYDRYNRLRTGR